MAIMASTTFDAVTSPVYLQPRPLLPSRSVCLSAFSSPPQPCCICHPPEPISCYWLVSCSSSAAAIQPGSNPAWPLSVWASAGSASSSAGKPPLRFPSHGLHSPSPRSSPCPFVPPHRSCLPPYPYHLTPRCLCLFFPHTSWCSPCAGSPCSHSLFAEQSVHSPPPCAPCVQQIRPTPNEPSRPCCRNCAVPPNPWHRPPTTCSNSRTKKAPVLPPWHSFGISNMPWMRKNRLHSGICCAYRATPSTNDKHACCYTSSPTSAMPNESATTYTPLPGTCITCSAPLPCHARSKPISRLSCAKPRT